MAFNNMRLVSIKFHRVNPEIEVQFWNSVQSFKKKSGYPTSQSFRQGKLRLPTPRNITPGPGRYFKERPGECLPALLTWPSESRQLNKVSYFSDDKVVSHGLSEFVEAFGSQHVCRCGLPSRLVSTPHRYFLGWLGQIWDLILCHPAYSGGQRLWRVHLFRLLAAPGPPSCVRIDDWKVSFFGYLVAQRIAYSDASQLESWLPEKDLQWSTSA